MVYRYEASAPLGGREKKAFDLITSQGSNRVDRIVERGMAIDFTNQESNCIYEILGQLKSKRTHFFVDPRQVIYFSVKNDYLNTPTNINAIIQNGDWFSKVGRFHTGPREFCPHIQTDRVLGSRVIRAEESNISKMYLEKLLHPDPSHFSWRVGESHQMYAGRLRSYEKCVYTQFLHELPTLDPNTSEFLILVRLFYLILLHAFVSANLKN